MKWGKISKCCEGNKVKTKKENNKETTQEASWKRWYLIWELRVELIQPHKEKRILCKASAQFSTLWGYSAWSLGYNSEKKSRLPLHSLDLKGEEVQNTSELRKLLQVMASEREEGGTHL